MIYGPVYVGDLQQDLDEVEQIFAKDHGRRWRKGKEPQDYSKTPSRSILSNSPKSFSRRASSRLRSASTAPVSCLRVVIQTPNRMTAPAIASAVYRAFRRAGLALIGCCAALAAAAYAGRIAAVSLLVVGTVLLTASELWQSAAAWEASRSN